jgi:hypothetical protein
MKMRLSESNSGAERVSLTSHSDAILNLATASVTIATEGNVGMSPDSRRFDSNAMTTSDTRQSPIFQVLELPYDCWQTPSTGTDSTHTFDLAIVHRTASFDDSESRQATAVGFNVNGNRVISPASTLIEGVS